VLLQQFLVDRDKRVVSSERKKSTRPTHMGKITMREVLEDRLMEEAAVSSKETRNPVISMLKVITRRHNKQVCLTK